MTKAAALSDDDALLDVAAGLFRRRGYAAATLRELAREAGIHLGSLHYRYPSKDALLLALMERAVRRLTSAVHAAVSSERDPAERLRLGLRAHLVALLAGDDSMYVLLYDWRSLEGPAQVMMLAQRRAYEAYWDRLMHEAVSAGLARDGIDLELLRQFGFGAMNWVAQWWDPKSKRTPEDIADAFWTYLAIGLLSPDRRRRVVRGARKMASLLAGKGPAARATAAPTDGPLVKRPRTRAILGQATKSATAAPEEAHAPRGSKGRPRAAGVARPGAARAGSRSQRRQH